VTTRPIPDFSLLETMRLEGGRLVRRDRHVARAAAAAVAFGYAWDAAATAVALDGAEAAHPEGVWRARLLVSAGGAPAIECSAHTRDGGRAWRVALADRGVDSSDVFLRHKTTRRDVYERARAARPGVDDVLLWNEHGEITESTIANVVIEVQGARYTPPASCGLLPGVFRGALLDAGEIRERVLTKQDVEAAERVWLINSLREWVPAVVVK
jgi:branched-subunit amino acid aminotransferase/4-amino-4-deoxychorismate lyase